MTTINTMSTVSIKEVLRAEQVVYRSIRPTPLLAYKSLSKLTGADIYVKHENHLPGGSFKIRGGLNVMHHLKQAGTKGVITFSMGNHGISIATAASMTGIEATVVVPKGNNPEKNRRIREAGAHLVEAGDCFEEAAAACLALQQEKNLYCIHAANEPHLINGVGTCFTEILRELPDVDAVIVPIGGGSELAAAVTVFKAMNPAVEIYAVQAELAQGAYLSWKSGTIVQSPSTTFAGGIATGGAYKLPFGIYKDHLTDFVLLTEDEIKQGMYLALAHTHQMAEGAGAVALMAAVKLGSRLAGKKVAVQMSGGNESLDCIREVLSKHEGS